MPHPLLVAAAICMLLAVVSLVAASGVTYDPYSWLIWGRDLAHLDLTTRGTGTSWKPLPTVIDGALTPLGRDGASTGWLVIARAGALFAVFMASRLAWRLAPRPGRVVAGIIAAATLVLAQQWVAQNGVGYAEGLMVAFGLLALDRHLDGHRLQAFVLLVAAGLIRVETWPFVAAYGVWLWLTAGRGRDRIVVAAGALAIPVLWFGGDWLGSGRLTTSADRALSRVIPGSPGASAHPALAVLQEAVTVLPLPAWIAIAAAVALPHARRRLTVRLLACAAAWTAVVAAMAQRGYGGLPRFLFMAVGLEAVVAGIGAACIVAAMGVARSPAMAQVASSPGRRVVTGTAGALASLAVFAAFAFGATPRAEGLPTDVGQIAHVASMDARLADLVSAAGGAPRIVRCGRPGTPWFMRTALAWDLGVAPTYVRTVPKVTWPTLGQIRARARRHPRQRASAPPRGGLILLRRAPSCRHGRV